MGFNSGFKGLSVSSTGHSFVFVTHENVCIL